MANPMYGQNKFDSQLNDGYLDFVSGYQGNLTATGITATDAIMIAALAAGSAADILAGTLVANAVNLMGVLVLVQELYLLNKQLVLLMVQQQVQ